jgi:hypothetical protein
MWLTAARWANDFEWFCTSRRSSADLAASGIVSAKPWSNACVQASLTHPFSNNEMEGFWRHTLELSVEAWILHLIVWLGIECRTGWSIPAADVSELHVTVCYKLLTSYGT